MKMITRVHRATRKREKFKSNQSDKSLILLGIFNRFNYSLTLSPIAKKLKNQNVNKHFKLQKEIFNHLHKNMCQHQHIR